MKKGVITILGTAGFNIYQNRLEERVEYIFEGDSNWYHNTLPFLYEKYSKEYEITPIWTDDARRAQEIVLKEYGIELDFKEEFLIKDSKDIEGFFYLINKAVKRYDRVIFDVSHGFRHLPILAMINLIIENIENPEKISKILFSKEIKFKERYEIMDLKKYLDISNIALSLRSFLATYKVPPLNIDSQLYKSLRKFSIDLTSNRFKELFNDDIPSLNIAMRESKSEFFFLENLLEELNSFIYEIESIKDSKEYEKFIFFSELFLNKNYLLNSATYLIEGVIYYVGDVFKELDLLDESFDLNLYSDRQHIVSILNFQNPSREKIKVPNDYFIDINYSLLKEFQELREDVGEIRHNLAHINLNKSYENLNERLRELIDKFKGLIFSKKLYQLDMTQKNQIYTVKYLLNRYEKIARDYFNKPSSAPRISKILDAFSNNSLDIFTDIEPKNRQKLIKFLKTNQKEFYELKEYLDKKILKINQDKVSQFTPKTIEKESLSQELNNLSKEVQNISSPSNLSIEIEDIYKDRLKELLINQKASIPKLETLKKHYLNKNLDKLNSFEIKKLKPFLDKNIDKIEKIIEYKREKKVLSKREYKRLLPK